ncbi:hypothetical protein IEI92_11735 [Microbispora bryophytorum]|nr:hypothetical protein [Microbispora bryophytorum]
MRALDKNHNRLQGARIKTWYTEYRVDEGNSFWVLIH